MPKSHSSLEVVLEPRQTAWLPRPCFFPHNVTAPPKARYCVIILSQTGNSKARRFEFLAHDLTARAGFEPRSCVLSKPSLEGDARDGTDLVLILLSRSECNCAVQCDKNLGSRWS